MNQAKDSFSGVAVHSVPLFASSWIALFSLLRNNLANYQAKSDTGTEQRKAQGRNTRH